MKRENGFSLLELAIVILLMFLLVSFLPLLTKFSDTYKLRLAAENIASELQAARYLAVARSDQIKVDYLDGSGSSIDPSRIPSPGPGRTIFIQTNVRGFRISDLDGHPLRGDVGPDNTYQFPRGVTFTNLPQQPIRFNSRGGSDAGAGTITVSNSMGSMDINISTGGRIQLVDNRGGS